MLDPAQIVYRLAQLRVLTLAARSISSSNLGSEISHVALLRTLSFTFSMSQGANLLICIHLQVLGKAATPTGRLVSAEKVTTNTL